MKRIAVLTSGGDSPGMNAAIRAVVRYGIYNDMEVFAVHRGYEGLIDNEFEKMSRRSVADILHRGGTIIQTSRSVRFMEPENRQKAYENLKKLGIEGLVVIGGNGSLTGAKLLEEETGMKVIGIPGTIDNDLAYTDYTIGFDTAVNTVLEAISKVRDTSSSHERSCVIEVMGRNCGDIALYSGITGGAEVVLLPEIETTLEEVVDKIREGMLTGNHQGCKGRNRTGHQAGSPLISAERRLPFRTRQTVRYRSRRKGCRTSERRILIQSDRRVCRKGRTLRSCQGTRGKAHTERRPSREHQGAQHVTGFILLVHSIYKKE